MQEKILVNDIHRSHQLGKEYIGSRPRPTMIKFIRYNVQNPNFWKKKNLGENVREPDQKENKLDENSSRNLRYYHKIGKFYILKVSNCAITAKSGLLMTGIVCVNPYSLFLKVSFFSRGFLYCYKF